MPAPKAGSAKASSASKPASAPPPPKPGSAASSAYKPPESKYWSASNLVLLALLEYKLLQNPFWEGPPVDISRAYIAQEAAAVAKSWGLGTGAIEIKSEIFLKADLPRD